MGVGRRGAGWKSRLVGNHAHPTATGRTGEPMTGTEPTELSVRFDAVVGQLVEDDAWHRRLRSIRRRDRARRLGCWVLHGFAEVGCWFTGVPAQRCTARPFPRPGDG